MKKTLSEVAKDFVFDRKEEYMYVVFIVSKKSVVPLPCSLPHRVL